MELLCIHNTQLAAVLAYLLTFCFAYISDTRVNVEILGRFGYQAFVKYFGGIQKFQEWKKEVFHYLPITSYY